MMLLPFSTGQHLLVNKGDVIELITGEKVTFVNARRTKWEGKLNGKGIIVPIYRDRSGETPFAKDILGKDESVITKSTKLVEFKKGDIFFVEGHKETFMYVNNTTKNNGKPIIIGRDLASGKNYNIDAGMTIVKVDLDKIKGSL